MYGKGAVRILWAVAAVVLAVLLFQVLLLAFASVLLAVFLRTLAGWVGARTKISVGWGVALVVVVFAAATLLGLLLVAPEVGRQVDALISDFPKLVDEATSSLARYGWGRWLLERAEDTAEWLTEPRVVSGATAIAGAGIGFFGNLFIVLIVGLFIAAEPHPYRAGLLRLVPVEHRKRAAALMRSTGETLRDWLLAKVLAMGAIFIATWIGLGLLGIPLALTLGLLAAILTFVPNFGPILSAIPAVLLALQFGTTTTLGVIGVYVGTQVIESYVLSPLILRRTVALPPALTMLAQVAMGVVSGGIGLVLATPLIAAVLTIGRGVTPELDEEVVNSPTPAGS